MRKIKAFSRKNLCIPYALFLIMFVIIPLLVILVYAFTDKDWNFTFENIAKFFTRGEYLTAVFKSIGIGALCTAFCVLLGYPVAYILSKKNSRRGLTLITLFILPMWMNFLLRTLATRGIFDFMGVSPGYFTTIFGMIYNFLPFMILPVYTQLCKIDKSYIEASMDLGAGPVKAFFRTTVPLSLPGVMSGMLMVFMPCISTFVISDMMSRNTIQLFGNLINLAYKTSEWNFAAALSMIMLVIILISTLLVNKFSKDEERSGLW